jgi:hypothetical protein
LRWASDGRKTDGIGPEEVLDHIARLIGFVEGVPAHFVFNMDEIGHQDWADRQRKMCIVPASHDGTRVYSPLSRVGKRITLIACIACDGSFLIPTVIVARKTVDADLLLTGLTCEKVTIFTQPKGFVDTAIFDAWFADTFLPELQRRRTEENDAGPAILILDNCSAHCGATFTALCVQHRVVALSPSTFLSHPSSSRLVHLRDYEASALAGEQDGETQCAIQPHRRSC